MTKYNQIEKKLQNTIESSEYTEITGLLEGTDYSLTYEGSGELRWYVFHEISRTVILGGCADITQLLSLVKENLALFIENSYN